MGRKSKIGEIESKFNKPIKEILADLYSKGTIRTVADQLDLNNATVLHWLKANGIPIHSPKMIDHVAVSAARGSQLSQLVESFILAKSVEGKTKDTIEFYRSNLARFLWWLSDQKHQSSVKGLSTDVIRRFLFYVQTSPIRFGGHSTTSRKPAGQATIDAYWRTIQSFTKWLVNEGVIDKEQNPITRVLRPRQPKVVVPDIAKADLISIFAEMDPKTFTGIRDRALLLMLLDTGVRISECLNLETDKIDLETGIIKVFGKGQKERMVRIGDLTTIALANYLKHRPNGNGHLWISETGSALTKSGVNSLFRRIKAKHPGIGKLSAHVFRHTFSVDYLRAGGSTFTLQMLGGWTDLDMPRRYAAALTSDDALKAHIKASPVQFLLDGRADDPTK